MLTGSRARRGLVAGVAVTVVGVLLAGAHHGDRLDGSRLVSGDDSFVLSGTAEGLAPGNAASVLRLTATNRLSVPITINAVTARITSVRYADGGAAPAVCSSYLDPVFPSSGQNAGSYTWSPVGLTVGGGNATATLTQRLVFTNAPVNQDACRGVTFALAYTGTATYVETYATTTGLTASANPPVVGSPVTYTATVAAAPVAGQDTPPSTPTGTVTFTDAGTPIPGCTDVVAKSAGSSSVAACTTTFRTLVAHTVAAGFRNNDGNFLASASPALVAAGACVVTPTTTAGTVTTSTVGNVQVRSGQSYWLRGGTVTGSVTVDAGGQFAATGGTIRGSLLVNGAAALSGTTVTGSVTATNAAFAASDGTSVGGVVIAQGSGPLCVAGSTVGSSVTAQNLRGTVTSSVCGSTIGGALTIQASSVPFLAGSGTACAGNTVNGSLTVQAVSAPTTVQSTRTGGALVVQSSSGPVTLGGSGLGNTVGGSLVAQGNSGGGTVVGNAVTGGSCLLQGNTPQFTGSGNTARGQNACNGRG